MPIERRDFEERRAGLNEVEDSFLAEAGAYAEKPLRDIARENDLEVSTSDKIVLDRLANRRGEKVVKKLHEENIKSTKLRVDEELEAERKIRREYFVNTEDKITEAEWQELLELTKGLDLYELISDLFNSDNRPLLISNYPILGRSPNLKISVVNQFFKKNNLLYRLTPMEHSGKYSGAKTFKLFTVKRS